MVASPSFLWHDYETFGADPRSDRPPEFACWRTDAQLEPIEEPQSFRCQPTLDYLPDPGACQITRIGPESAFAEGLPEHEFAGRIQEILVEPGSCGVGYNSLRFDDELTRHVFWRNFIDPYEREWTNGNCRFDLIDLARAAYALRPEGIEWPLHSAGKPSFKLTDMSRANGLPHRHAHAALSDVEATIALARLLRHHQPRLFNYALGLRQKTRAMELLDWRTRRPMLHVSQRFPAERGCIALVVPLAAHPSQANKVIVADAYPDPEALLSWDPERIAEAVVTPANHPGRVSVGLKVVHANRFPFIAPLSALTDANARRIGFDRERTQAHARSLIDAADLDQKVQRVFALLEQGQPRVQDPELALYAGFVANDERARMQRFRRAAPEDLAKFAAEFSDPRVRTLAVRYRARHYPEHLNPAERVRWLAHCRQRLTEGARTLESVRASVKDMPVSDHELAKEISAWCNRVAMHAGLEHGTD